MLKLPENTLTRFSLVIATLSLAACGGGGSGSTTVVSESNPGGDTPVDTSSGSDDFSGTEVQDYFVGDTAILKAGVFSAMVTYVNDNPPPVDGVMLLSPTGNYTFIMDTDWNTSFKANIVQGTLTSDGISDSGFYDIEGPVVEYELFDEWFRTPETSDKKATIVGVVPSDDNDSAFLDTGTRVEEIAINRDPVSDLSLSFAQIQGIYESTAGPDPQIIIDGDGGINGVDRGCIIEGQITIPVAAVNVYELSYKASGCTNLDEATGEERDGDYLGIGTFTPASSEGEGSIEFAASNGKIAFYFAGTR
ncbi:hypothetical protein FDP08_02605 [Marinobacter panjinensis]|uniref:Transferrin-binding protein B C-lobe/N-lobe beta barrel domain-containing protein n=1 Tax=Marinobacter panjinensis TaxID=2576384 RepID=A0A4U6R426_9GAMM|nr:hypothetical protein [Marinobacter panjinensis]MCR8915977.1 hypothetical protein [Marinobacter panjinensis]TKV67056.1 hypothetical protein FDP08_02605 [Marinobacter panjinensis]